MDQVCVVSTAVASGSSQAMVAVSFCIQCSALPDPEIPVTTPNLVLCMTIRPM